MSAGDVGADVKITLTADDQASSTIASSTQNINSSFRAMRQQQDAMGRQFLVNNQGVFALGRAMQSTGRIVDRSLSLFNSYNLMQIRIAQATQNATDAQENLAQTIAQYGANSVQATRAAHDANKAMADAAKAAQEAKIQFALMVASMVAQSGTMLTTVIPRLIALKTAMNLGSGIGGATRGGKILSGIGAAGGIGLGAAGLLSGGASADNTGKLMSSLEEVGGGALAGFMLGGPVGAAVGAGVGAGLAIAQNVFNIQGLDGKQIADEIARTLGIQQSASGAAP